MAFTETPTGWFPSWSEDGTNITVPLASFSGLTAAHADAAGGDIREIIYAILETCWAKFEGLAAAARPTMMIIKKDSSSNEIDSSVTHKYTFEFVTLDTDQSVGPEPVEGI